MRKASENYVLVERPKKFNYAVYVVDKAMGENRKVFFSSFVNSEKPQIIRAIGQIIEGRKLDLKIEQSTSGCYVTKVA